MAKSFDEILKERGYNSQSQATNNQATNSQTTAKTFDDVLKERGYTPAEPTQPSTNKLSEFFKTSGYRSAAQATDTSDALTYLKKYNMANNQEQTAKNLTDRANRGISVTPRQRMYAKASSMIDKDTLENQSELTKNLQQKAAEHETILKEGNGPVANTLIDMGLAGTDMLTKAAASAVTKVPLPVLFGITGGAETFQEDINQGKTINQALTSGIGSGVITGGVESLTGIGASGLAKTASSKLGQSILSKMPQSISNYLSNAGSSVVGKVLSNAFGEGLEEGIEYDLQRVYRNLLYDENTPRDIKEQAYNALIGAGVGGMFGGASAGINSIISKRNKNIINQEYDTLEERLPEDSPTLQKIKSFKDNQVNVTDEVKLAMIEAANQELGQEIFNSETDGLIKDIQNENTLNEQIVGNENNIAQIADNRLKSTSTLQNTMQNAFNIKNIKNSREVKQNIYNFYKDSIISTSENSKPITNKASGNQIEVSRATINQTFQADEKFKKATDNEIKIAAMEKLPQLISNGDFQVVDENATSKSTYAEINGAVNSNGLSYNVKLDIRKTDNGKKMFVHSIKTEINKTSGIVSTGYETRISTQEATILDRMGQAVGKKIKIVPSIASPDGSIEDFANGQYIKDENTIEISLKANNPILVVAKHEITHTLQEESPKLYKEYKDYVISSMKENGTYEKQYDYMGALAEKSGIKLSKSEIEDEIVADATELYLTNEQSIKELVNENPTLGKKILSVLRKFIDKIGEQLKGVTADWLKVNQLKEAERLWVNALNDVAEKNKTVKPKEQSKAKSYSLKDSEGNILTKEQAEYFKNSKVLDGKGNLLKLYHGTDRNFTVFEPNYAPGWGTGIYLTDNKEDAKEFGNRLIEAYVNIIKPYYDDDGAIDITNTKAYKKYYKKWLENEGITEEEALEDEIEPDIYDIMQEDFYVFSNALRELGYDGIIAKDSNNISGYEIVAFKPEQVKSIDNKNPTENTDIRYSLKDMDKKYLEAVNNGDLETAKKMVIDYAESKGYTANDDYRGSHEAPINDGYNAPLYDLTQIYPKDVYDPSGVRIYGLGDYTEYESMRVIKRVRNNPDAKVTMYRAVPKNLKEDNIRVGDWVTLSRSYAEEHGEAHIDGPYKIISNTTEAKNLWTDANSLNEFGFDDGKSYAYQDTKNNLKLLDAVVYDDEGNIIPLSKRFNKRKSDVRYQLKDTTDSKEIERLKRTNERLKEQFKLTKGVKLDEKSITKLSKNLVKDYSSKYDSKELEIRLKLLYTQIANNDIDYDDMETATKEIARDIIENASVLNDEMYREYSRLRRTLRNVSITIGDKYKADLDGGYNEFRKRNIGLINLVKDGMGVDVFYQELAEQYPELFNADITNQADQLMLISDVLDNLVKVYENPFNRDMNQAINNLSLEIFNDFVSIPEAKPTYADKQKAKLDKVKEENKTKIKELKEKQKDDIAWLKYQNKERIKEVVAKEKEKRDNAVAAVKKKYSDKAYREWWKNKLKENDIKSHYQEMIKELRTKKNEQLEKQSSMYKERISKIYEDRKIRDLKSSIKKKTGKLDKMLRKPDKKNHIPQRLEKSIAELMSMLDFTTDRQKALTRLKLTALKNEYEKMAKASSEEGIETVADPYIVQALDYLNGKRLSEMSLQELEILYNVVSYFEHMVKSYSKAFLNDKWVDIIETSNTMLNELNTDKPENESAYNAVNWFKDMMKWGMLTPQMYFERLGNTSKKLWYDFRKSLDVKIENTKIAQDYMKNLLKGADIKTWTGDKAVSKKFKVSGGEIELTPSQIMSLYLLNNREQARGHILGLGIKAAPIKLKEGVTKKVKKQFEPVKVTPEDVAKIIGTLTKEQKRIADGIGKFMNTISKEWINETQLKVYGYKVATEENYFPIKTDRDYLKSEFDNTNLEPTFTSMSFLKSTVKGAGNPIIIEDVFDVFTEHADKSSTYNAFAEVTETTKKIINFKTKENSIKQAMNKKYGMQAFNYLKKFMIDLQGGIKVGDSDNTLIKIANSLIKNTKRSLLSFNVRTIIQQPTAIIRATAMIDNKYIVKGIAAKSNLDEMLEYSPIALWKSWGYFNLDTGRTMKDIILNQEPILDKQYAAIQKADDITWTKIWNAVKFEIEDTTNLKKGTKEYFEAVSNRFSEIIDRTQVVDTVMHRSALMRDKDSLAKLSVAFMSEPTKAYNLVLNAAEKYKNSKTDADKKALARTISAWVSTMLVNTLVITMVDMWRRDEDDKETVLNKYIDNLLNDITGYVPLVRDIYSIAQGYSVKRMEYYGIERVYRAMKRTGNYIDEITEGEKHNYSLPTITKDWFEGISYMFGVGAANVSREIEAALRNYTKWINDKGIANGVYENIFKN
jgi:hypothetical protein